MKKRIILLLLVLSLVIGAVNVRANIISDGVIELNRAAERYYNTTVAYADMTVYRPEEGKYEIYHAHQSGKILKCVLYLTEWGTWNLGNWNMIYNGAEQTVIGGGTDWEYVVRVTNPITQNLDFTGGNHGSETLNYLSMYDSVTGEVFTLEVGESKYVNRLVIEEGTTLLQGNVSYLKYANVVRKYTFAGNIVSLDCKVEFIRDVKLGLSYTAMAAVNKEFGRYCMFDDGTYVASMAKGFSSNERMGNRASMTCTLTGDNTDASVTVAIYNSEHMTDNFSNNDKTFLWDMSEDFNKLYFSKGDITEVSSVSSGTVWDWGTSWKINL